jgi:spore coat polysaccharide biosynthesis protein SpsF (cytidylyltransferase family)
MIHTVGIVEPRLDAADGRTNATRKCGGKPLLEWVVRRATDCQRLDRVRVLIGPGFDKPAVFAAVPADVPVFVSRQADPLLALVELLAEHPAHGVVRIPGDNLYVDPVLIDRLVRTADEHPTCDYVGYCHRERRPGLASPVTALGEWCRADALRRAVREASLSSVRQPATRHLYAHPELFNVRLIPAPQELDLGSVRLTVECEEDWEHVQTLLDALGPEALDWRRVAGLLESSAQHGLESAGRKT